MDSEIKSFIKTWCIAITSLIYCYYISSRIPKGIKRLTSIIPVLYLFIYLPLDLHTYHLCAPTVFFLVWLANFKLILFSFDQPPLSPLPNNPFHFISIACLPIKLVTPKHGKATKSTKNPSPTLDKDSIFSQSNGNPFENTETQRDPTRYVDPKVEWSIRVLIMATIFKAYEYRPYLNPHVTMLLYILHLYIGVELVLAVGAIPARTILGFEIEPQSNEPYLTTSLHDFWSRRWNLVIPAILKPTAYEPMKRLATPILGPTWAQIVGFVWAFTVSGLMHEVVFYYLSRVRPTWEVTSFFVLHGVCTVAEVAVKRRIAGRWRPNGAVSWALTMGFLFVTGIWLYFPQMVRDGLILKGVNEYLIIIDFAKRYVLCLG